MSEDGIAALLERAQQGDRRAVERLFDVLYAELHRLARGQMRRERAGHTLTPTALVHEAYFKLAGALPVAVRDREHFYAVAVRAMRQVLVSHAEKRSAEKRGGGLTHVTLGDSLQSTPIDSDELMAIDDALTKLEDIDPRLARMVEYRFFAGLDQGEVASLLDVAVRTVKRDWRIARAWLRQALGRTDPDGG